MPPRSPLSLQLNSPPDPASAESAASPCTVRHDHLPTRLGHRRAFQILPVCPPLPSPSWKPSMVSFAPVGSVTSSFSRYVSKGFAGVLSAMNTSSRVLCLPTFGGDPFCAHVAIHEGKARASPRITTL